MRLAIRTLIGALAILLNLSGTGRPAENDWLGDARGLLPACKAAEYPEQIKSLLLMFRAGACMGEVDGILRMIRVFNMACPPNGVDYDQAIRVVIAYIENHPVQVQEGFGALALAALHETWPCPKAPQARQ